MNFRPSRLAAALVRLLCRAVLRAFITGLIFAVCLTAALAYLGVPLPDPRDLPDWFESVSKLSGILS